MKQGAFGLALKAAAGLALFAAGWFGGWMTAGNAQAQALRDYCLKHRAEQNGAVSCELPRVWVRPPSK